MASLLHCCLQKLKTVSLKTVKNPIQNTYKDIRNTLYIWHLGLKSPISVKSWPKVTKVDPKNTKKRPIY